MINKFIVENFLKPIAFIVLAMFIGGVLIFLTGKDPVLAIGSLLTGALGGKTQIAETLVKTVPLLICGLAVAMAYRSSFFNIGAEGQFLVGALASTWFAVSVQWPSIFMIPATFLVGAIAGGLLCGVVGLLKIKTGASEVINTLMFNYIAFRLVGYAVNGPLKEGYLPQTASIANTALLPIIWPGTRLHIGIVLAVILAIVLQFILFRTVFGYQIRAVGLSARAATYGGINASKRILQTTLLSGALAGLAGSIELMGVTGRLYEVFSPGYGFDAIAISLLARNNPAGVIVSALLFGILRGGAGQMQRVADVSMVIIYVIQALIIVFVVLSMDGKKGQKSIGNKIKGLWGKKWTPLKGGAVDE